jgi:3-methyl-2-oxobutanoate hydroxymethyltransferase
MRVPVIGIGAGPAADGQVLVFHDLLGIYEGRAPRFAKRFAEVKRAMVEGMQEFAEEVRERRFPGAEHTYGIDPAELERFREIIVPGKPWDAADAMG